MLKTLKDLSDKSFEQMKVFKEEQGTAMSIKTYFSVGVF